MTGSRVNSWALSIAGDVPPPLQIPQPSREVHKHPNAHDQVNVSIPPFNGRFKPALYIEWEFDIKNIFASHNFNEHKKVKVAVGSFTGYALVWWSEYCRLHPDYIPTTWDDLKLTMRHTFVPAYYTRDMIKKLQHLKQGSETVTKYYDDLQTTLLHSSLEESEDDFMDRFWGGLNRDIQEILIHEECYPMDHLFHLACKAEQEIKRRVGHEENKRTVHIPRVDMIVPSTTRHTMTTTSVVVRTTSPPPCDTSPPRVATSSELIIRGNDKGTDLPSLHENDECLVNLNAPSDELPTTLITPPILEDYVDNLTLPCDQTTEIPTILSAPIELTIDAKEPMFNHFDMTSNLGDDSVLNDLLHVCLFKHVVACKFDASKVYSPMLGWFNDEHCQSFEMNKSFTYMCKLSCNIFMPSTSCANFLALDFMNYASYSSIHVSYMQKSREVKMDDIYIYNMYTLSLLLATFQIKQRRGRLYFQEGEDDEDMTTLDMTKNIAYMHICQVISSANYSIIYLCYPEQKYFTHFCVLSNCRCMGHLYNPHMKIRKKEMFICCPKSSLTSLLAQEKIESKSLTFWIQIRTAQTYLTQNAHKFFIRTPNWVILFLLETRFRALSNPIGITFKFVRSVELWTKQSDAAAESESNYKSKGVTSPPLGPIGLVRPRFSFRLPWDVLPPPWPPPLAPI